MNALARFIARYPWPIIVVFALLTVLAGVGLTRLAVDASVTAMYPDHAAITDVQDEIERTFGAGQMLVAVLDGEVFTPASMQAIRDLTLGLGAVPGITDVISLANAQRMEDDDGFLIVEDLFPAFGPIDQATIDAGRAYLETATAYRGGVLAALGGGSANLMMEADPNAPSDVLVSGIREQIALHWTGAGLGQAHLAGGPAVDEAMRDTLMREAPVMVVVAAALIVLMLYLNFRNLRGALLPLLTVVVGLVWSVGMMGWLGGAFTTITPIAPVAILAVGSSFSLHLLGRYAMELAHRRSREAAVATAVRETGVGVLISGMAIAAALATLGLSGMSAVRELGWLVAGGVLAALAASLLLLPAILVLMRPPKRVLDPEAAGAIGGLLRGLARFVDRRRKPILLAGLVLAGLAAWGATRIEANTAVISYFRQDSEIRRDYQRVEEAFGGSAQVQVLLRGDMGDPATLQAMLDFQEAAQQVGGMGRSNSIADVLGSIHQTLTGEEALPASREAVAQEMLIYQMSGDVRQISRYVTVDGSLGRIDLSTSSGSTAQLRRQLEQIEALGERILAPHAQASYAGSALLQLAIEDTLLHDFLISLSLAIVLVIVIDSFVRSLAAALVTIIALLLTIALQYGLLGLLGVPLDLATMLLGALAIGVGDYAIHLTVRYMEQRRAGQPPEQAMAEAIFTSGRSVLFTALTLGAGFGALLVSSFVPIRTLGGLMAFTVLSVGVTSLTLLPAACLVFLRNPRGARNPRPQEVARHA